MSVPYLKSGVRYVPDGPLRLLLAFRGSAEVRCGRAEDVEPIPGAALYLDPPYDGTSGYPGGSTGYGDALEIAERWAAHGSRVVLSSHIPLRTTSVRATVRGSRARSGLAANTNG